MRVLEVATGSGEMFGRLARINPNGLTCGFDLSPNMAARTQRLARRACPVRRPTARRWTPVICLSATASFDAVVCCYLLELMGAEDILRALGEIHRVSAPERTSGAGADRPERSRVQRPL